MIIHHLKFPGDEDWRELVDEEARRRIAQLEDIATGGDVTLDVTEQQIDDALGFSVRDRLDGLSTADELAAGDISSLSDRVDALERKPDPQPYDDTELRGLIADKQPKLTAGQNIIIDPVTNTISAIGGGGGGSEGGGSSVSLDTTLKVIGAAAESASTGAAIAAEKQRAEGEEQSIRNSIPTVPGNVSAFTNDAGYLTEHQDISGKVDRT